MSAVGAEKGQEYDAQIVSLEKGHAPNSSTVPLPTPRGNNLHFVDRAGVDGPGRFEDGLISGYNETLMRARVTLSSADENKLLRRIDWHLIPLLAVIYMLKSVDFTNVSREHMSRELC